MSPNEPDGPAPRVPPVEHPPEAATGAPAATLDVDLDAIAGDLAAVDEALARLDAGTYGVCESCRDPIGDEVLADDPTARACAAHLRL